jgi:two-component system chemotaxis response regulator CheY
MRGIGELQSCSRWERLVAIIDNLAILVVDDHKTMVRITADLLRQIGFRDIDGAADGAEALAMAQTKKYDLVISDWNMAEITGLDLLHRFKAADAPDRPRFIMVSAESRTDRILEARNAGADAYVVKPYSAVALRVKIDNMFRDSAAA